MRTTMGVELILSYISIGWTYVLFTTPTLFEQSENWSQIKSIANYEWVLGCVALVCAMVKIIGVTLHNRMVRYIGLIMSAFLWIFVSASFLVSSQTIDMNTGFITYSGLAVLALWTSKEVRTHDRI